MHRVYNTLRTASLALSIPWKVITIVLDIALELLREIHRTRRKRP